MVAALAPVAPYPVRSRSADDEQRVLIGGVPWATYVTLRDSVTNPGVRMTYLKGWLEIMSPSRAHEVTKTQIARLLELYCLERDIPLYGYGSTTFRNEDSEPDECYSRDAEREVPELALEVVKTHGTLDKLEVYSGLGVGEVWVHESGGFRVLVLRDGQYVQVETSELFPQLDLTQLATLAESSDQHEALRAFRESLRIAARPADR